MVKGSTTTIKEPDSLAYARSGDLLGVAVHGLLGDIRPWKSRMS